MLDKRPSGDSAAPPLCIVTFVTPGAGPCFYATHGLVLVNGQLAPICVKPDVQSQLESLAARVAWIYVGDPYARVIGGEAQAECPPVTKADPDLFGRVVFAS